MLRCVSAFVERRYFYIVDNKFRGIKIRSSGPVFRKPESQPETAFICRDEFKGCVFQFTVKVIFDFRCFGIASGMPVKAVGVIFTVCLRSAVYRFCFVVIFGRPRCTQYMIKCDLIFFIPSRKFNIDLMIDDPKVVAAVILFVFKRPHCRTAAGNWRDLRAYLITAGTEIFSGGNCSAAAFSVIASVKITADSTDSAFILITEAGKHETAVLQRNIFRNDTAVVIDSFSVLFDSSSPVLFGDEPVVSVQSVSVKIIEKHIFRDHISGRNCRHSKCRRCRSSKSCYFFYCFR